MDREQVRRWEAQCIEEQPPACTTACPMHVDARQLVAMTSRGDLRGGFGVLASAIPLPNILAHICDHPCQRACRRSEAGDAIRIHALERACATFGAVPIAERTPPEKSERVTIAGGGLSGVSAAILLARKGYRTRLIEPGPRLLGALRGLGEPMLPEAAIAADLAALEALGVAVVLNQSLPERADGSQFQSLLDAADALFFEAGAWPPAYPGDALTLATSHPKIFAGNAWQELSPIFAVFEGSVAAISIDRFLQGASLTANRGDQGAYPSRLFVNTSRATPLAAVEPVDPVRGYTREEAAREAGRCLPCECLECVRVCEYLKHYGSYPKRYIREIYNNECIVMGVRKSNRMVNSCALCGLCAAVCPEKLSMAEVCLEARRTMVEKQRMPPSAHEFALRDMAFSNSDAFALARHQPGLNSSRFAFLPGCQLAASAPEHVVSCYEHLRATHDGGVGLLLGCCGAPALWAGKDALFGETTAGLRSAWDALGRPRLITACSSCFRTLHEHAPEIPVETLWAHLDPSRLRAATPGAPLAIHDPCSTRAFPEVEDAARGVLRAVGVEVEELNERGLSTCCGFGGLMQFANPELADRVVERRSQESGRDYITYCAMCRDRFAHQGKRAAHILDLLFPGAEETDPAARADPGFSHRQENRARLKGRLLRELWGEGETPMDAVPALAISDEVRALLEKRMILDEDIRRVVEHAEQSGEKLLGAAPGRVLASWRPNAVTYWVEYSLEAGTIVVHNAWSHRMQVK
jgi:glutamate synthase (NADPH/NADH) small chain